MSDDPLDAGLEAGYGKESRTPGESVVAAIERLHGARSHVVLREADEGATPVSLRRDDGPAVDDSRYQVMGEVARGGVGVIYRGRDKDLNRDVALKVLRKEHAESPDVIQRFIEEAQVGGQLQHPGIVPVYGMGLQPDGRAYFAMKFIKGRTLSALMDSNPQGYDLLAIFEQLAQAMAYAHSRGVIHRDLKPANVMIGSFGEVIVVDWGFAKVLGLQEDKPKDVHTVVATVRSEAEGSQSMAGSVMGTPAYMPPEQAMGLVDELDERSDVFALGAILCEILTGEPPYTGSMRDQLLAASQARLDEAHTRLDECDAAEEIKQIARDCLQPLGKDRPAEAGVVAQRLSDHFAAVEDRARRAELETIKAASAEEQARSARRRTLVLAAVALVAIVGSGGSYFAWRNAREAQHAEAERNVTAALDESARYERDEDLAAAFAAAEKAVKIAEADQWNADEARATRDRLGKAVELARKRSAMAPKIALLVDQFEAVGTLPVDELYRRADALCTEVVDSLFGKGEHQLKKLEEFATAADDPGRLATLITEWAAYCNEPKRTQLMELAARIDPAHAELNRALLAKDAKGMEDAVKLFDDLGLDRVSLKQALWVAMFLQRLGRREKALDLCRGIIERYPDDANAHDLLGAEALHAERYEEGMRHYAMALAIAPDARKHKHQLAIALHAAGRPDEAENVWRELGEQFPDWWHGQNHHVGMLLGMRRLDEAEAIVRTAIARDPEFKDPESHMYLQMLGWILEARGEGEAALEAFRERAALAEAREDWKEHRVWSHHLVAQQLSRNGDDDAAIDAFERVRAMQPERVWNWHHVIKCHVRKGNLVRAAELARIMLSLQPNTFWSWEYIRLWFQSAEDVDAALDTFTELVESDDKSPYAWTALGKLQYRKERYDAAEASIQKALALNEDHTGALVIHGELLERRGKTDLAIEAYRKAEKTDPLMPGDPRNVNRQTVEVARGLYRLGKLLQPTDLKAADEAFAGAVRRALATPWYHEYVDNDSEYHARFAETRAKLGDNEGALRARRNAYYADPESFEPLYQLGLALYLVEKSEEAIPYLEKALTKEESKKNIQVRGRLAEAYRSTGDAKRAVEILEETLSDPEVSDPAKDWYYLGLARRDTGDHERAVQALEQAAVHGGAHPAWTELGKALGKTQSTAEVRKSLKTLLDRCEGEALLYAINGLNMAYNRIGDQAARIELARELASRKDKEVAKAGLFRLAEALGSLHRHEEALAALDKLDAQHPDASRVALRANLRVLNLIRLGRFDDAAALVPKLRSQDAEWPTRLLAMRPRISAIRNGTELPDPIRDGWAYYDSGQIRLYERNYDEAVAWFKRAGLRDGWAVWGAAAAANTGDRMGRVWFRDWLRFQRKSLEQNPGSTRDQLQKFHAWPAFDPVREDPAWEKLWAEYDALLKRARELTW